MKALVVQNATNSGLGAFQKILEDDHAFAIDVVDGRTAALDGASRDGYDLVVILGSARGVYETQHPWIVQQLEFTRTLLEEDAPLLGICFGGQLIASALGSAVRPMPGGTIRGWHANDAAIDGVWRGPWFRWHGDHFDVPPGATTLASDGELSQAFQIGRAVGVQFHPEVDERIIASWVDEAIHSGHPLEFDPATFLPAAVEEVERASERTRALVADMLKRTLGGETTRRG
ncbi:type 1 glutamine amidotransferase [Acuticoccus kandeliae]|uniref:type 1 glutamine amidotransferase n=1 Tax=Acuticoccus kandeliae TaxID=2073160 RepID=UPI000D3E74BC|nr:type 1 glutamine amidotransferase [Acuticoccus kandeliae]